MTEKKTDESRVASLVFGIIFLVAGTFLLLGNSIEGFSMENLWPLFFLIPISVLTVVWIQNPEKDAGVVLPVVILTFLMGYFLWLNFTTWDNVAHTWPNFLIAPGLGFVAFYFSSKKKEVLIPAVILLTLAVIFYSVILQNTFVVALLMILTGLFIVGRSFFSKSQKKKK